MKKHIHSFAGAILLAAFGFGSAAAADAPPVVVELFTSQGCSSCPPAEAYMRELAKREDVIGLEYHVDYWDYIGWKDVFADPAFTRRQKRYVSVLGARYVYTPQIVIGGRMHVVGSRHDAVEKLIHEAQRAPANGPTISLSRDGDTLVVQIGRAPTKETFDVTFVTFDRPHTTVVRRGENRGLTLVNANVVRELAVIGTWSGKPGEYRVSLAGKKGDGGCAVIVQKRGPGRILTAARLPFRN